MTTSTAPSGFDSMRTVSNGPKPALLHEHREAGADRFAVRAPLREIVLQFVPLRPLSALSQQPA